jgi:hypothetical protein
MNDSAEKNAAKDIVDFVKKVYVPRHEYAPVNPKDFSNLDLKFYEQAMKDLIQYDFRHVIDQECVTLKGGSNDLRTFIRVGLSSDGTIMAGLYHPKPRFLLRLLLLLCFFILRKVVDLETEFSDGSFIVTSNIKGMVGINTPPDILTEYVSWKTPISQLLELHKSRVHNYLQTNQTIYPVQMRTIGDINESQNRMQEKKAAYRKNVGWITKEEMRNIAGKDNSIIAKVCSEIKSLENSTVRMLILDSVTKKQCSMVFERLIAPEIPADIQVDYAYGWKEGLERFSKDKYAMVVIESILALKEIEFSQPAFTNVFAKMKALFKKTGTVKGTIHIPGFSGEKISNLLIYASDCICQMQAINPETKYIVCCHLTSGYSREEREKLSSLGNVIGVLNFLNSKGNRQKIITLIKNNIGEN